MFDTQSHAITGGEDAIWNDDPASSRTRGPAQPLHHELKEQEGCFCCLLVNREARQDAALFFAAEGGIRAHHLDTIRVPDRRKRMSEAVQRIDLGGVNVVEEQVHLPKKVRKWLRLPAKDRRFAAWLASGCEALKDTALLRGVDLCCQMSEGFNEEATGAARGV